MRTGAELAKAGRDLNTEDRPTVLAFRKEVEAWARAHAARGDSLREGVGLAVSNALADVVFVEEEIAKLAAQVGMRLVGIAKRPRRVNMLGELRVSSDAQQLDARCIELDIRCRFLGTMLSLLAASAT